MSDSSEENESELPSGAECKERSDEFVKLTETNSALAMFYLQNCSWDLQCAVNFYFEKNGSKNTTTASPNVGEGTASPNVSEGTASPNICEETASLNVCEETASPNVCEETASPNVGEETASPNVSEETASPNVGEETASPNVGEETASPNVSEETAKDTPKHPQESVAVTSSNKQKGKRVSLEPRGLLQNAALSEDKRIRLLSWNIDGLDSNNLKRRTKAVCQVIANENPHVVFLQEVVPESLVVLKKYCPDYQISTSNNIGYFTAILLKESAVKSESEDVFPFFSSVMSRCLLISECIIKDVPVLLINTHLESMANHTAARQRQLYIGFKKVLEADKKRAVIFGGDLNLRDKELEKVGGIPNQVIDIWESTGKRPEAKFTWDTQRNDNKGFDGRFKPRCRFDRIYFRDAQPKTLKPVYFELVGLERIPKCDRFPSDHWGLLVHVDIEAGTQ